MSLSVIAVRQLIVQFSMIEKQYSKRTYQIEAFFSEENWLIFVEFKGKDAWEAAVFPGTGKHRQPAPSDGCMLLKSLALVKIVAIFAIGLLTPLKGCLNMSKRLMQDIAA